MSSVGNGVSSNVVYCYVDNYRITDLFGLSVSELNAIQVDITFFDDSNANGNVVNSFNHNLFVQGNNWRSSGMLTSAEVSSITSCKLSLIAGNIVYSTVFDLFPYNFQNGLCFDFDYCLLPEFVQTFVRES